MSASDSTLKSAVKQKYGEAALRVSEGATSAAACCGSSACCGATTGSVDPITADLMTRGRRRASLPKRSLRRLAAAIQPRSRR
jgi:hypothetical protein